MVLAGEAPPGGLDRGLGGSPLDAEDLVRIAIRHPRQSSRPKGRETRRGPDTALDTAPGVSIVIPVSNTLSPLVELSVRRLGATVGGGFGIVAIGSAVAFPSGTGPTSTVALAAEVLVLATVLGWVFAPRAVQPGVWSAFTASAGITALAVPLGAIGVGVLIAAGAPVHSLSDDVGGILALALVGLLLFGLPFAGLTFLVANLSVGVLRIVVGRRRKGPGPILALLTIAGVVMGACAVGTADRPSVWVENRSSQAAAFFVTDGSDAPAGWYIVPAHTIAHAGSDGLGSPDVRINVLGWGNDAAYNDSECAPGLYDDTLYGVPTRASIRLLIEATGQPSVAIQAEPSGLPHLAPQPMGPLTRAGRCDYFHAHS